MALCINRFIFRSNLKRFHHHGASHLFWRWQSSLSTRGVDYSSQTTTSDFRRPVTKIEFPLSRLSTSSILRSLFLSIFFSLPVLYRPGLVLMTAIANSKSTLLNPDKNPVLRTLLKPLIYDQFCAGTNHSEVQKTVAGIKHLGFSGVILCYGKELQVGQDEKPGGSHAWSHKSQDAEVKHWKDGNLQTLSMIGEGDWLGIKFTGAGQFVTDSLLRGNAAPISFLEAMNDICEKAAAQGCRIWIDAEQQAVQTAIENWTVDLMRRWNKRPQPLIYNTVQAYLKKSRNKLQHQLRLAQTEGWTLGVKLVRGAYISNDIRDLIHDTKAETDASYEGIVKDLLQGTLPGFSQEKFPKIALFLAGHNPKTIRGATKLARELFDAGKLKVAPEFGQLQGMADDIGCELLQCGDELKDTNQGLQASREPYVPLVYKCLTWGSVQECMQYLVRRAVENQGATERLKDGSLGFAKEIKRRVTDTIWRRSSTITS